MKAYSLDLRQRVPAAAPRGDRTIPEVAGLFGVSMTFVNKLLRLHRAGSDLAPRPHGGGHTPRLGARHHKLLHAAVAANNDATLGELRAHLARRARVEVSEATVSRALTKLGLPRKKKA
ncbi:MAG TPA: hypothetical protein VGB98_12735 [Pyrinomonadaceae bacterium]